jgi:murein DD-endopeptidase MepM/ murein hydrolase activator NlpD
MKKILFIFLLVSYGSFAQVQPENVQVFGNPIQQKQECISPELRTFILNDIKANTKKFPVNALRVAAHPLFIFPIKKTASMIDPGFFAITNFVDINSAVGPNPFNQYGSTNGDYNCGNRTYDTNAGYNHAGIDISTWPWGWEKMENNKVEIIAAADGIIISKVDGNSSYSCGSSQTNNWNAVVVRHADNSVAYYGHMKQGSLTTKAVGSAVVQGEFLGIVGSSGLSTGPHLHFEVHNASNAIVDPFFGSCSTTTTDSWWQSQLPYYDKLINALSTHSTAPVVDQCPSTLNTTATNQNLEKGVTNYFAVWGKGLQASDVITTSIIRPNGTTYANYDFTGNTFPVFLYYLYYTISTSEPNGTWKFRSLYNGVTTEQIFYLYNSTDISATVSGSSYCGGQNLAVNFDIHSGTYNAGNVFTAQLSDVNGSFSFPTNIGTLTSTTGGTINYTIPTSLPAGTGYRLKVISSSPVNPSVDNGININIQQAPIKPTLNLTGNQILCPNTTFNLTASGCNGNVTWSNTSAGTILTISSSGTYTAICTNICGTSASSSQVSFTTSLATKNLSGNATNGSDQATQTISSTQIVNNGINTSYNTGKSITLTPSFAAVRGSVFSAKIIANACNYPTINISGNLAFGACFVGTPKSLNITITNLGADPLNITSVTLPAGFTSNFTGNINGGASQVITITLTPTVSAIVNATATVNSNASSGTNTFNITASIYDLLGGLKIYMPFSGNTNDVSGNANNGTNNGATLTLDRLGNANSAYSFNGSSNYISATNPVTGANYSVCAWVKTSSSGTRMDIVTGGVNNATQRTGYYLYRRSNNLAGFDMSNILGPGGTTLLNDGNWHYLVGTAETGSLKVYVDGVLQGALIETANISSGVVNIGKEISSTFYFNGSIDEVRIYNRALAANEVLALYQN